MIFTYECARQKWWMKMPSWTLLENYSFFFTFTLLGKRNKKNIQSALDLPNLNLNAFLRIGTEIDA